MNNTEQETWEVTMALPTTHWPRRLHRWRSRLRRMARRWQRALAWARAAGAAILRAPELVRLTAPGRQPEREHEWKRTNGNGFPGGGYL